MENRNKHFFDARTKVEDGKILGFLPYLTYSDRITDVRGTYRELLNPDCFIVGDDCELYLNHSGSPLASIRGGNLKIRTDTKGLYVRYTPRAADEGLVREVATGYLDGISPGFRVIRDSFGKFHGENTRTIHKARLYEVSLTSQPCYFGATTCLPQQRSRSESGAIISRDGLIVFPINDRLDWSKGVIQ